MFSFISGNNKHNCILNGFKCNSEKYIYDLEFILLPLREKDKITRKLRGRESLIK